MRYYSEEDMKNLRVEFEEEVLGWPVVSTKRMFGCPCYQAKGKLFAFLVTKGVVITQLGPADRDALSRSYSTAPFKAGRKTVQAWRRISIKDWTDLKGLMPFVRKSYEVALGT